MAEILKFVNNMDEVDLLDANSIYVYAWEPAMPTEREITSFSQFNDGSSLINQQYENVIETMSLYIVGTTQDQVLTNLRNLRSILKKGVTYYTGLTSTPTYLQVKSSDETNSRYAVVRKFRIEKIPQVLGQVPFSIGALSQGNRFNSALVSINLAVELSLYRSKPPGSYETALISGTGQFNSITYGNVNSSQVETPVAEAFIAAKYHEANISHVFVFDDSLSSFSSNQAGATLPWNLFPSTVAVDDILYVGSQSSITDSGPFSNVFFDVTETRALPISGNWEYYNGAWAVDRAGTMGGTGTLSGVWAVNFGTYRSDETTVAVNGVTGYWRRFIVTSINGSGTTIQQQNRRVYSTTWPYIKVASDQLGGDEPTLLKMKVTPYGEASLAKIDRIIAGLRSTSRGSSFNAYINLSDEQVDDSLTVSVSGMDGAFASYLESPTSRVVRLNETGIGTYSVATISANSSISDYSGRFRAFLLVKPVTVSEESDVQFYIEFYHSFSQSVASGTTLRKSLSTTDTAISCIDLGEINTVPHARQESLIARIKFIIKAYINTASTIDVYVLSLILIPVDEWSCDLIASSDPVSALMYAEVDSTSPPETDAIIKATADDSFQLPVIPGMAKGPRLQHTGDQKLWFLLLYPNPKQDPRQIAKIQLLPVYQYLTPRGDS